MNTIQVSSEVRDAIESQAKFGDTHDSILRRHFGVVSIPSPPVPQKRQRYRKAPRGTVTPQTFYRKYILLVLKDRTPMKAKDVVEAVLEMVRPHLKDIDFDRLLTGDVRCENAIHWERNTLTKEGLLDNTAGHGIWKLTKEGWEAASLIR